MTQTALKAAIALELHPTGAAFSADPYRVYAKLRQLGTPYYYAEMDAWLLSTFTEVDEAARNNHLVRSLEAFLTDKEVAAAKRKRNWHDMPNHARLVQTSLLDSDGEPHRRLRTLLLQLFPGTALSVIVQ